MNPDPTQASPAPEAELPQAPPGADSDPAHPHDAVPTEPANAAGSEQAPVAQAPVAQAPVAQAPVAQAPVAQDPVEQDPVEQAPFEPAEAFEIAGEELEALTAKAEKADEYLQLAQRTQADFENYRKRAARDAAIAKERGATKLALELLPAVDNLERALAHAPTSENNDEGGFVSGIKHVHSDVVAALQRAGIERYSPEGEQFDP
ncbi:MAG TPA: nucleotide exchange factor GrpE, partial [Solirubrobacteraceae bacterium]